MFNLDKTDSNSIRSIVNLKYVRKLNLKNISVVDEDDLLKLISSLPNLNYIYLTDLNDKSKLNLIFIL